MRRSSDDSIPRRRALAALASGASVATAGCVGRLRALSGWESQSQVRLEIKTVPADADPYALRAARQIVNWLTAAGIDARVRPVSEQELYRQVLLNRDFDVFLARASGRFRSPDSLYALLHSRYVETPGWQNPFGYADLDVNELLETQRRTSGEQRREAVADLQRSIARSQPFTVLAFPDDVRAARTDRFTGWRTADLASSTGYLGLDRVGTPGGAGGRAEEAEATATPESDDGSVTLRAVTTDRRATTNLNPLAVEFRRTGVLTGLLYDTLGRLDDGGEVRPWLAESWSLSETAGRPAARVRLREGVTWHDGEPVTAEDAAFTYRLLADTSLGGEASAPDDRDEGGGTSTTPRDDGPLPAPRFQGRSSLVEDVTAVDDRVLEVTFVECDPAVAVRAFTVPVLPEHVWVDRTAPVSVAGIEFGPATEALVTDNVPPVGSGPMRFVENTRRESLILESNPDHFLGTEGSDVPGANADGPPFERLEVRVVGSDVSAVGVVTDGDADVTLTSVGADTIRRIGRTDDTDLVVDGRTVPYLLGYNASSPPLTNPQFRNTLARLIDRTALVDEVFDGYATPSVTPLSDTEWIPEDLRWDGEDPVTPFIGSEGELDVPGAREAFRAAGYSYDDGRLVRREIR
ncbi:ABC transporter substrate-binding protein [Halobaculum sp. CBA1158]|uniref:ABC transporter substrate-binding protein n=1 Tax=Halobaculum sp. CBA1158 TaxID=2904243 RepID=UPI001F31DBBB|nr:ABC transporter substrate-binding protein [Halobaculum sp. CBA1158]UIP00254.1 ABC transporter substrate-binding protein [Halobaculum sp. CBA1158]